MSAMAAIAAAWWLVVMMLLLASAMLAMAQPRMARARAHASMTPPVSILIPLRDDTDGLAQATASIFAQRYPAFDVTFSSSGESPALERVRTVARHDSRGRSWRTVRTLPLEGVNPKVANLAEPIRTALHDHILIKDANTALDPDQLQRMAASLVPGVGLVAAVPIARDPETFAAEIECAIINTYGARLLLAASALGLGFGIGAAMLTRRGDLLRADGLATMARSLADDQALAKALSATGLRTVIAEGTVSQRGGRRPFRRVWQRHLRWALCRRTEAPAVFAVEPLTGGMAAALAAALAAPLIGVERAGAVLITLLVWVATGIVLAALKGWPLSPRSAAAMLAQEALSPALWLAALLSRQIGWAGAILPTSGHGRERHGAP
jgi:ceramide glucosyltransferase